MRIEEIISEPQVRCYSIGDSHGEGMSYTPGIVNYAHGGQPSTSSSNYSGEWKGHPTGIDNVPPGSRVIISQGCNDAANSSRANIDSNGRTPLVKPERIAANVARLVDAATSKGCQVIFVLFPNGNAKIKPYYGGAYQLAVREAIRSAVGVPVIDLEGSTLTTDGVHCTRSAYQSAGARALAQFANKTAVKATVLNEVYLGNIYMPNVEIAVNSHAYDQADDRRVGYGIIDHVVGKVNSLRSELDRVGTNGKVWIWDPELNIGLGLQRLLTKSPVFSFNTLVAKKPYDGAIPVITVPAGTPSIKGMNSFSTIKANGLGSRGGMPIIKQPRDQFKNINDKNPHHVQPMPIGPGPHDD